MEPTFIFFSQLQSVPVIDKDRKRLGLLDDIIIEPMGRYAKAKAFVIRREGGGRSWAVADWQKVADVSVRCVALNVPAGDIHFSSSVNHKTDLSLGRDILDQQVVDTNNQNVIRVNDIDLLMAEKDLVVAHVDIGLRGIVRRLGFERVVDGLVRLFDRNAAYLKKPRLISWKHIQPLSVNPVSMTIKVDVSQKQLAEIPAADLGEIMLELAPQNRVALFKTLDIGTKSQLFRSLDFKEQRSLLEDLEEKEAVDLLNHLPADEAVDFLGELPRGAAHKILGLMESKTAKMLSTLLGYSGESAGGLMTTEFIAVSETATVEEALATIKEKTPRAETIQNIFIVTRENRLAGTVFLRRLIIADPKDPIAKAANKKTISIHVDDEVKKIALLMEKYNVNALPVIDDAHLLVGIITMDDIFSRLVSIAWRRKKKTG